MIRPMEQADFPPVYDIVKSTGSLDVHTPYTYWVMLNLASHLAFVCERDGDVVGFVAGLAPFREADEALVWQIGVRPDQQGKGIGTALLGKFTEAARGYGFGVLCITITADNAPSLQLFTSYAKRFGFTLDPAGATGSMSGHMREELIYRMAIVS